MKVKKNSLQGWGCINFYSFELIVKSKSIAISNEALKNYRNFIQITFATRFKAEDIETKMQQSLSDLVQITCLWEILEDKWLSRAVVDKQLIFCFIIKELVWKQKNSSFTKT